jgi:hypothetical protein
MHKVGSETINQIIGPRWRRDAIAGKQRYIFGDRCGNAQLGHNVLNLFSARVAALDDSNHSSPIATSVPEQLGRDRLPSADVKDLFIRDCFKSGPPPTADWPVVRARVTLIATFREPLAHVLSARWYYTKKPADIKILRSTLPKNLTFDQLIAPIHQISSASKLQRNGATVFDMFEFTNVLSGVGPQVRAGDDDGDPWHLAAAAAARTPAALAALGAHIDVVGIVEATDSFALLLALALRWPDADVSAAVCEAAPDHAVNVKQGIRAPRPEDLDAGVRARFTTFLAPEAAVFDAARAQHVRQTRAVCGAFRSRLAQARKECAAAAVRHQAKNKENDAAGIRSRRDAAARAVKARAARSDAALGLL